MMLDRPSSLYWHFSTRHSNPGKNDAASFVIETRKSAGCRGHVTFLAPRQCGSINACTFSIGRPG